MSSSTSSESPKAPAPQRLTLEEKLWFDRRKSALQQCAGFGAAVGAATGAAVTSALLASDRFDGWQLVMPSAAFAAAVEAAR